MAGSTKTPPFMISSSHPLKIARLRRRHLVRYAHQMNFSIIPSLAIVTLAMISCPVLAADSTADAAWQKVQDAMNSIRSPKERPKTRDEAIALFKSGLIAFDAAMKDFTAVAPNDPRRWQAKLF